jgi:hypothetical protein
VALGWLAAVVLHMIWNGLSHYGLAGLVAGYVLMAWVLGVLVVILVSDRRRLVRLIRTYLPPYAATGLVTAQDVAMLASLRVRRAARNWARLSGGVPAGVAMGTYQLASTELALLHDKESRGVVVGAEFARRRAGLLSVMHAARSSFLGRGPSPDRGPFPGQRATPGRRDTRAPWAADGHSSFTPGHARQSPLPPPPPR